MIYTSYFVKLKDLPDDVVPIAICAKPPAFYTGLQYKKLAPGYETLMKYKYDNDTEEFKNSYMSEVLDHLDANEVYKELNDLAQGKDIALLCFERPTSFCHRHLVTEWLSDNGHFSRELIIYKHDENTLKRMRRIMCGAENDTSKDKEINVIPPGETSMIIASHLAEELATVILSAMHR